MILVFAFFLLSRRLWLHFYFCSCFEARASPGDFLHIIFTLLASSSSFFIFFCFLFMWVVDDFVHLTQNCMSKIERMHKHTVLFSGFTYHTQPYSVHTQCTMLSYTRKSMQWISSHHRYLHSFHFNWFIYFSRFSFQIWTHWHIPYPVFILTFIFFFFSHSLSLSFAFRVFVYLIPLTI